MKIPGSFHAATLAVTLVPACLTTMARAQVITEFRVPTSGSDPLEIAPGPGGMWFTEHAVNRIGLIAPGGDFSEFPVLRSPSGIVTGPDANVWFTSNDNWQSGSSAPTYPQGFVSRITPTGVMTNFVSDPFSFSGYPLSITVGPDGRLWFTDADIEGARIGHVSTAGQITDSYVFTSAASDDLATTITSGPDGNLWFTVFGQNRDAAIDRVTPSGVATEFALPGVRGVWGITAGPDGNLWFTETNASKVGRITPSGAVTEFTVSGNPRGIAAGPDGNLWFAENGGNKIGRISIHGQLTEFPVPTPNSRPWGIAAGADGNIWFTERGAGQIGRITLGSEADPLRLDGGRFLVTAEWQSPTGSGPGHPVPLTGEAGYFWFFDPANVEVIVKLLDWCPAGGITFFAAGLTNLDVSLTVTDQLTGLSKSYVNPQGAAFQPIQDELFTCSSGANGSIAGTWTGTFDPADYIDCDGGTPAQASFQQNGSVFVGTLNATGNSCGFAGVTLQGTLNGSALDGTVAGDRFTSGSTAKGTLSGTNLEISLTDVCPGALCIPGGQMHLHR